MKKFLILTCMIACIFGLSACGSSKELSSYEQEKVENAKLVAAKYYVPYIQNVLQQHGADYFDGFTSDEVEYVVGNELGLEVDGYAFVNALQSFDKANVEIGGPGQVTGTEAVIDDDQIIVTVSVQGDKAEAKAEIVVSNDMFLRLESASLNKVSTVSDSMAKAGMNTLLGMGSVFVVLILISLIISCFAVIPKIQAAFAKKEDVQKEVNTAGIENAVAQITHQEEESDDLELIAVIAAAIAASEGAATTDGFVVRSIKRRKSY